MGIRVAQIDGADPPSESPQPAPGAARLPEDVRDPKVNRAGLDLGRGIEASGVAGLVAELHLTQQILPYLGRISARPQPDALLRRALLQLLVNKLDRGDLLLGVLHRSDETQAPAERDRAVLVELDLHSRPRWRPVNTRRRRRKHEKVGNLGESQSTQQVGFLPLGIGDLNGRPRQSPTSARPGPEPPARRIG